MNIKRIFAIGIFSFISIGLLGCSSKKEENITVGEATEATTQEYVVADYESTYMPYEGFDIRDDRVLYGDYERITYYSTTTGTERNAIVLLPPGYDVNTTYPIVYMLHGVGGTENEWLQGKPVEIIGNLIDRGMIKPFIAVMPNVRARANDRDLSDVYTESNFKAFDNFIYDLKNDLMPYINEHYNVSTAREDIGICGLSMGGMEALSIGFQNLEIFGYIGAFSPAPTLNTDLLTLEGSEFTPYLVMICTGDKDSVVLDTPRSYHDELQINGVDHVWYEMPGGEHKFMMWNEGLYNFLKIMLKPE